MSYIVNQTDLLDRQGKRIGTLRTYANGDQDLLSVKHGIAGYYFKNENVTKDKGYVRVGTGNLLAMLLKD